MKKIKSCFLSFQPYFFIVVIFNVIFMYGWVEFKDIQVFCSTRDVKAFSLPNPAMALEMMKGGHQSCWVGGRHHSRTKRSTLFWVGWRTPEGLRHGWCMPYASGEAKHFHTWNKHNHNNQIRPGDSTWLFPLLVVVHNMFVCVLCQNRRWQWFVYM